MKDVGKWKDLRKSDGSHICDIGDGANWLDVLHKELLRCLKEGDFVLFDIFWPKNKEHDKNRA